METRRNSFPHRHLRRGFPRIARRGIDAIRHEGTLSALATGLLLLIVLVAPLPFGGVLPGARAGLQAAAFLALALALVASRHPDLLAASRAPLVALVGVAGLGAAQSLPWPHFLAARISPRVTAEWQRAAELLGESPPFFVPLSIAPTVSLRTALHFLAIAACLAAATIQGRERGARRVLGLGLFAGAVFQILYGAEGFIDRRSRIWGVDVPGDPGRLRGTFVNPDHFAFYQSIALAVAAGWLWWVLRRILRARGGKGSGRDGAERHLVRAAFPVLLFGVVFVGLAFSGSRAGTLAAVAAILAQGLFLAVRYRRWQWGFVAVGGVALGAGALALFGWRRGLGRWLETSAYEIGWNARLVAWRETVELWWLAPVSGTGLGTFRQAFPMVQPAGLPGTWRHAHNDVLELLATVGPLGWLLLGAALAGLGRRLWRVFHRGRRSEDRAAALGALGATTATCLHSLVDFGSTIPANAFTLAVVLGAACGVRILPPAEPRERRTVFLEDLEEEADASSGADERHVARGDLAADERAQLEQVSARRDLGVDA